MRTRLKTTALALVGTLGIAAALTGCNNPQPNPYVQAWYDVYGYHCGDGAPRAGCNFYWDGQKIIDLEDPYWTGFPDYYFGRWEYTNSYGYAEYYDGWAWLSSSGIVYDEYGNALNNDAENEGRDLIGDVAAAEQQVVTSVGKQFAEKYALQESTGVQIAKTLNDWATLSKKQSRARTEQDIADFSKRLYGVSVDKAKLALAEAKVGSTAGLESVNQDVAKYWGTSPETSKQILKGWYKNQLDELGVK